MSADETVTSHQLTHQVCTVLSPPLYTCGGDVVDSLRLLADLSVFDFRNPPSHPISSKKRANWCLIWQPSGVGRCPVTGVTGYTNRQAMCISQRVVGRRRAHAHNVFTRRSSCNCSGTYLSTPHCGFGSRPSHCRFLANSAGLTSLRHSRGRGTR
ncbi:hypothetical protein J6590_030463 [Homalodisca vitripennis]|nr:hypothetical protein J6590_030463 [Homalodisca vitripennis]